MKLIVKNGQIIATHLDSQVVSALYPGCSEMPVPDDIKVTDGEGNYLALADIDLNPWDTIRTCRNQLLKDSDWTQNGDSPLDETAKAEWAAYRQALRDIPQNQPGAAGFLDIVWPVNPDLSQ